MRDTLWAGLAGPANSQSPVTAVRGVNTVTKRLPYPFDVPFLRQNAAFLLFCPPDRLDAEGRPVLEGRSMCYSLDKSAFATCTYGDSRRSAGKLMNVEALRALSRHQEDTLELIRAIGHVLKHSGERNDRAPDLNSLYALAYVGYRAPSLYFCQQVLDTSVAIPTACAVFARFAHGLVNVLALIALEQGGKLSGSYMTAEQLYRYADERGHLIGVHEACAASHSSIVRFLEHCLEAVSGHPADVDVPKPVALIVSTAALTIELELACLVYETVRCAAWYRCPLQDGAQLKQMFAVTHCLQAKKIAQVDRPFEHLLFTRARALTQSLVNEHASMTRLIELARESIESLAREGRIAIEQRHRLKAQLVGVFAMHADRFGKQVKDGCYLTADLDVFFGRWPLQCGG